MASDQAFSFPPTESEQTMFMDDEMMHLLFSEPGVPQPATQPHMPPLATQQSQGNEATYEPAQLQSQFSGSPSFFESGNLASAPANNTVPPEPAIGNYFQRPEVAQAAAEAQRFNTALANAGVVRDGKRFLKPWIGSILPIRQVEMLSQKQLDSSIASAEQAAAKLLSRYNKQRTLFDMSDGLTPQQSDDTTREVLLAKAQQTIDILMQRVPIQLDDFIVAAQSEAEQRRDVWFVLLLARLIQVCLEFQYVYEEDTSIKDYFFEENYYKRRCCELESWKAAIRVLSRAGNEEIARLDRRLEEYRSGRFMPS